MVFLALLAGGCTSVRRVEKPLPAEYGTYVFDIAPKKLEKSQRYFQGRIWVEDKDLQIVKTRGKATGLLKKKEDQAFPTFETFRENIWPITSLKS